MYKASVLLVGGVLLVALAGCGSNPRDAEIDKVIQLIGSVTSTYSGLKNDLTNAIEAHKKTNTKLTDEDWKKLTIKAEELKKTAQEVQAYKGHLDTFRETTSEEQKKRFATNYGPKFRDAIIDLDREERALDAVILNAEKMTETKEKTHLEWANEFRKKLKEGKDVFELLTKQG